MSQTTKITITNILDTRKQVSKYTVEMVPGREITIIGDVLISKDVVGGDMWTASYHKDFADTRPINAWIATLSRETKDEGCRVRCACYAEGNREIFADWVEEHGGDREWARLIGVMARYQDNVRRVEKTFEVGDLAEYDSLNLSYYGKITKITPNSVWVENNFGKKHRMSLYKFCWRNHQWDAVDARRTNRSWMD